MYMDWGRGVVVVIVGFTTAFYLLQSLSITTKVVSSNYAPDEVLPIQLYVITVVSDLLQVDGCLLVLPFPPLIKLTTTI